MRNKTKIKTDFSPPFFPNPPFFLDSANDSWLVPPCATSLLQWGPSHRRQSFINCSNMGPFQRLWCSKICFSMNPFQEVQPLRNKLLQPGIPMGHNSFQKIFSCINFSPWARSVLQWRLLKCFWGIEFSIGYRGTICFTTLFILGHRNICSTSWSTFFLSFTELDVRIFGTRKKRCK